MSTLRDKRLFLFDMDGTLYLEDTLFDGTLELLHRIREKGGTYLFLTNNSSKGVDAYVEKLTRLGIPCEAADFLTSTDATVAYVREHAPSKRFYCVGTRSFVQQLRSCGLSVTDDVTDDAVDGVILSNDTELTFAKLSHASRLLTCADRLYLATNPDWVCQTSFGSVPDCGSFAQMLEHATGKRPYVIGKPRPDMLQLAMRRCGCTAEETLMVGDRLYTDIAAGVNAGVDTVFVLSGEGTRAMLASSDVTPTYVMEDVRELCRRIG